MNTPHAWIRKRNEHCTPPVETCHAGISRNRWFMARRNQCLSSRSSIKRCLSPQGGRHHPRTTTDSTDYGTAEKRKTCNAISKEAITWKANRRNSDSYALSAEGQLSWESMKVTRKISRNLVFVTFSAWNLMCLFWNDRLCSPCKAALSVRAYALKK